MTAKRPTNTVYKVARKLFEEACDQEQFVESIQRPDSQTIALLWFQAPQPIFEYVEGPEWFPSCVTQICSEQKPGKHPLHAAGAYYCLDPSSVFAGSVFMLFRSPNCRVLDLCAAPGGKSLLCSRLIDPKQLVANEVSGKRISGLLSNFKRCQVPNAHIVQADPSKYQTHFSGYFDLVIVDAPCSGQSLLVKGRPSPGCFHPSVISRSVNRQRRIISSAVQSLRSGGALVYVTCTYSLEENEGNIHWLLKKHPTLHTQEVPWLREFRSHLTEEHCYRLWPYSGIGTGSFVSVLRSGEQSGADGSQLNIVDVLSPLWSSSNQGTPLA